MSKEYTITREYLNHEIKIKMSELVTGKWNLYMYIDGPIVETKLASKAKEKIIEPDCGIINKDLSFSKALDEVDNALAEAVQEIDAEVDREMRQKFLDEEGEQEKSIEEAVREIKSEIGRLEEK